MLICGVLVILLQEPSVEQLLRQLEAEAIESRDRAERDLTGLGEKAEDGVRLRLTTAEGEVRTRCERILGQIRRGRTLKKVLPPLMRLSHPKEERELSEVLAPILEAARLKPAEAIRPGIKIVVDFKEATPLEALEAVCKAAKLNYDLSPVRPENWPGNGTVRFEPAKQGLGTCAFVRHYKIEAIEVRLTRSLSRKGSSDSASLKLGVSWTPAIRPESAGEIEIIAVRDDQGKDLLIKPSVEETSRTWFPWGDLMLLPELAIQSPTRGAKKIASLKGRVAVRFPVDRATIAFKSPAALVGERRRLGGLAVALRSFKVDEDDVDLEIVILADPSQGRDLPSSKVSGFIEQERLGSVWARTENGDIVPLHDHGGAVEGKFEKRHFASSNLKSKVVEIEVSARTAYFEDVVEFELKDVPLPE